MRDLEIRILTNGEIHISRSIYKKENEKMMEILCQVVSDKVSLDTFLKSADDCKQLIGDEPLCG